MELLYIFIVLENIKLLPYELENILDVKHEDGKVVKTKQMKSKHHGFPLASPTYQVISVLLHCLTAEKQDKGGWGRDNTKRLLFLRSN